MEKIKGEVKEIIFKNDLNGYTIFNIICEDDRVITVIGNTIGLNIGEYVIATGNFVENDYYGRQFKAEICEKELPKKKSSIIKFLGSGIIKGVGESTAEKILDRFGEESFDIMLKNPIKLSEIKGISKKKAEIITESFKEYSEMWNVAMFLQKYGISPLFINKIYRKFNNKAIDLITKNPYILADEISGIGFKTADKIALSLGFDPLSEFRIASCILYVLSMGAMGNGYIYMPKNILCQNVKSLLDINDIGIENAIFYLSKNDKIFVKQINDEEVVYLKSLYYCEKSVASKLFELSLVEFNDLPKDIDKKIVKVASNNNIELAEEQKIAIKEGLKNSVTVITGGPGTGKTTIINTIIQLLENMGITYVMAAPTGRAAKRVTESTGKEAKTIHRLLELMVNDDNSINRFEVNENYSIITEDVVIVDESSMIDIILMNQLLNAITIGTRLIIVGDKDQLPAVGPGNVLKDIINSEVIKVVKLTQIYRQSAQSMIILNAHNINSGKYPKFNEVGTDFFLQKAVNNKDILKNVLELVTFRLPTGKGYDSINDIQVLSPTKKGILGVKNINIELQKILNPHKKSQKEIIFGDFIFRVGDKIMQVKNNYDINWSKVDDPNIIGEGLFNGDLGTIVDINEEEGQVISIFDDKKVIHDKNNLEQLDLSYAITVHKSQGSEFKVIVMPVFGGFSLLNTRNLLYTAITRAKELVVIVGIQESVNFMVDNYKEIKRYSSLEKVLQEQKGI